MHVWQSRAMLLSHPKKTQSCVNMDLLANPLLISGNLRRDDPQPLLEHLFRRKVSKTDPVLMARSHDGQQVPIVALGTLGNRSEKGSRMPAYLDHCSGPPVGGPEPETLRAFPARYGQLDPVVLPAPVRAIPPLVYLAAARRAAQAAHVPPQVTRADLLRTAL